MPCNPVTLCRNLRTLGSHEHVLALPDTGAERNVIDFHYAQKLNLVINRIADARNYLQFADGSYKQTMGQIHTHWTFASGKRISITFEVLKNCASNVVIGEQVLYENKVFTEHLNDFRVLETEKKGSDLAPFDFLNRVEGALEKGKRILGKKKKISTMPQFAMEENVKKQVEEQRREAWNDSTDFGKNVDEVGRRLEKERREMFEKRLLL
ncbi:hypothetical protein F5882DRAFT_18680 [Hyaloscypha sp. PMI_1271]|nr:hypothetical protein F5882DRAFT_18680 [Hyaloscypha sp. PMI_1271]